VNKDVHPTHAKQVLRLLFWETTIRCNLTCAHCRRVELDETVDTDLSTDQGKQLIQDLAELGRSQSMMPILVFSGGEPLCRNDLFELVDSARTAGITSALATNGTLIDSAIARRIANSGIARVSVSLDGATAEVHDRLRQLKGAFEKAIQGLTYLKKENIPFQINMTLTRQNAHQLEEVYTLAKSLGAVAVHLFMLVPVGCGEILAETDMRSPEEYEKKMVEIRQIDRRGELQMKVTCGPHYERILRQKGLNPQRSHESIPGRQGYHGPSRGCLAGLGVLFVGHQGAVFPCGYLPIHCGNVLKQNLSQIWRENPDLAKMRDSNLLEGKCGICEYRWICGGCRGRAYAATGNYMAEEPFCQYIPPKSFKEEIDIL